MLIMSLLIMVRYIMALMVVAVLSSFLMQHQTIVLPQAGRLVGLLVVLQVQQTQQSQNLQWLRFIIFNIPQMRTALPHWLVSKFKQPVL